MQWSDVTKPPTTRMLRQFAGLCGVVFPALAGWRMRHAGLDAAAVALAAIGLVTCVTGFVRPSLLRWVFMGWMVAAFPLGWVVSRLMLGLVFFGVFTPAAVVFRLMRRDLLHRRRDPATPSYWTRRPASGDVREYFRQS